MRIFLADDQLKVRFALRLLLDRQPGMKIIGEAHDADSLMKQMKVICPDILLLDWELPGLAKNGSLTRLREACPDINVVALSGRPEAQQAALTAGADAFVSKTYPPERLLKVIQSYNSRSKSARTPK